jgi:1-acyl-sn-glycerol-3-phosphate acyltransferase
MTDISTQTNPYNHARFEGRRTFLRFLLKYIGFTFLAKVDKVEGLENVPTLGPAIMMINHINFIDPFVVLHLLPRNIVPLAKIEVYDYPVVGIFPRLWGIIPVHREETDRHAIQQVLEVLKAGEIVLVAPEGTRSPQLQQGRVGVAYMASRGQAPIVPVAISDTTGFPTLPYKSRWKGPGAHIRFGRPFRFRADYRHARHEQLRKMTDEAMYILATMLPPEQRGVYSSLSQAKQDTIEWI